MLYLYQGELARKGVPDSRLSISASSKKRIDFPQPKTLNLENLTFLYKRMYMGLYVHI